MSAIVRNERRRTSLESLERRELFSAQPPLIADAAPYTAAYVEGVYRDALERQADANTVSMLTQQVDQGLPRANVPAQVVQSPEYRDDVVQAAFRQYLGRNADPEALAVWTSALAAGVRDEQLMAALVASNEFYQRVGGDNAQWINAAYQALLGRAAMPNDLQVMSDKLGLGATRATVAMQIADSPEYERRVVNAEFEHYLHSAPDADSSAVWVAQLDSNQASAETLAVSLMSGDAYYEEQTGVPPTVVPVPFDVPAWQERDAHVAAGAAAVGGSAPLVFVGDSITQNWQGLMMGQPLWDAFFKPMNAFDAGVGGDSTQGLLWRIQSGQLDGLSPKVVVLMIGINNILSGESPQVVAQGVSADIAALHQHLPNSRILLLSILPAMWTGSTQNLMPTIQATNQLLAAMADGQNVVFVDLWSTFTNADGSFNPDLHIADGLHLNTQGYTKLILAIAPTLDDMLAQP